MTLNALENWRKKGNQIAIFCAGKIGVAMYEILKRCGITADCFFDNDAQKHHQEIIDGCYCLEPCGVEDKSRYLIFIGILNTHYEAVEKDVRSKGFERIEDFVDFFDDIIVNYSERYMEVIRWFQTYPVPSVFHRKPNGNSLAEVQETAPDKKIAVYTGIFGGYDNIHLPEVSPPNIDYYFISDEKPEELGSYQWIPARSVIPGEITSPLKKNRYIKMHPHLLFPEYDYSVYVDGNIAIRKDVSSFIKKSKSGISAFRHPTRDCIFYESMTVVNYRLAAAEDVCRQMERYLREGMPIHFGLLEMGVLAREHHNPVCIKIMEEWWREFNNGAQRDQLSFMYTVWKNKLTSDDIASLGSNCRHSEYLSVMEHQRRIDVTKRENG